MKDVAISVLSASNYLVLLVGGIACVGGLWWVYSYFDNDEVTKKDRNLFSESDNE